LQEVLNINLQTNTRSQADVIDDVTPTSDEQLVQAVLDGDETAFAVIFERYTRPMTRVVSRFFRERSDIEEFVQQSFTKAYFSLKKYRGGEENSFPAWMTRIAVNVCYDEFRRRGRRAESLVTDLSSDESDYLETVADGRKPSVERLLAARQLTEKILSVLDEQDRIAMTLVYSEDYSLSEVAEAIGISTSNLKSRLFRCRNQIKSRFGHLFK
ncbi:MAG: sigma-70 family RNA polymerase sigma factor, partial [Pyrinomonadaceae bacterium]|nr:sigma-70 family RNA polymerase sigma factor [Pyrinomonadaceae bacterium]